MKKIDIGQAISVLANIGVLLGIVFLAYELRQNTVATELIAAQAHLDATTTVNQQVAENPHIAELIARSLEGGELSRAERLQLSNTYATQLRVWQNTHYQFLRGALNEELWRAYSNTVADIIVNDRDYERYWRERLDHFTPGFNEVVESTLAERRAK